MPRPLNWIKGEGTVKNQRWGLGDLTITDGSGWNPSNINNFQWYQPTDLQTNADTLTPESIAWGEGFWSGANTGNNVSPSIGSWLQQNALIVGLGVIVTVLILKRS